MATKFKVVPSVRYQHNVSPDYADYEVVEVTIPEPGQLPWRDKPTYYDTRAEAEDAAASKSAAQSRSWKSMMNGD